ncbi:hypothetical protein D8B24_11450 [Verminephrobacter aporrectodeae subsp. tuberculatae]|uniref:hypothetical protein n=1 Tax=Verminephrobacter aporrectodeae TaxID=1110389 RepID=UPI00224482F4|nr:hypothetical protein [Verminephrobacter aporrectodeae]MCW8207654.1 hypothetical protein [Verminephrobacter aporrectodeae subsp. tuberculatae]
MKKYSPKFSTAVPAMDSRGNIWEACGDTIWPAKMHDPSVTDLKATLDVYVHRDVRHTETPTVRLHGHSGPFSMIFNMSSEEAEKLAANLLAGVERVRAVDAMEVIKASRRQIPATAPTVAQS